LIVPYNADSDGPEKIQKLKRKSKKILMKVAFKHSILFYRRFCEEGKY